MGTIIELVLKYKVYIIMALMAITIGGQQVYISLLGSQKATLVAEKNTLKLALDESQSNLRQLKNDIQAQNDAVQALKADSDARLAKNAEEVKKAQKVAGDYKKQAEELLKRRPPENISKCDAANLLINEEIRNGR
jgi:predicted  nucleic acid-binding Zn-ribbon protein